MQVTWQGVFTPLLGGKAKTTKNILDLNFVVSIPFNENSAKIQLSFTSTSCPTQNHPSTLSKLYNLWMVFNTKGSPATDPVGTAHRGSKFGRGLPVPRITIIIIMSDSNAEICKRG